MTDKIVEMIIVLLIVAFIMYKGIRNAEKERHNFKYMFRPRKIGLNPPEPFRCRSLEDIRKHSMFKHWKSNYRLWQSKNGNTIKMVKDGDTYDHGIVVGWLEYTDD